MKIINNFLKKTDFKELVRKVVWSAYMPIYLHDFVTYHPRDQSSERQEKVSLANWYGSHIIFLHGKVHSSLYPYFLTLFKPVLKWKSLVRIKVNFYGHTDKIHEHIKHRDFAFKHKVALLSLNTCNGFTRIGKKKIYNVANRALLFNGETHNSTTCTNSKGRYNVNINYK